MICAVVDVEWLTNPERDIVQLGGIMIDTDADFREKDVFYRNIRRIHTPDNYENLFELMFKNAATGPEVDMSDAARDFAEWVRTCEVIMVWGEQSKHNLENIFAEHGIEKKEIIDFQEKLMPAIKNTEELEKTAAKLIQGCRVLGLDILLTQQYTKGLGATTAPILEALTSELFDGYVPETTVTPIEKTDFSATVCNKIFYLCNDFLTFTASFSASYIRNNAV